MSFHVENKTKEKADGNLRSQDGFDILILTGPIHEWMDFGALGGSVPKPQGRAGRGYRRGTGSGQLAVRERNGQGVMHSYSFGP